MHYPMKSIEIYNLLGANVFTETISKESRKKIYLKNLEEGIYFVKISDGLKSLSRKLIVHHN